MRYMIIVKASDESEAETSPVGEEELEEELLVHLRYRATAAKPSTRWCVTRYMPATEQGG